MGEEPLITITQADIEAKRKEVEEYEARAKEGRTWLEAAEFILGRTPSSGDYRVSKAFVEAQNSRDLTAAVEEMANRAIEPLLKATIKDALRANGFPEARLQNYFYTVIARLKEAGRISVMDDGRLWRKPQTPLPS